MLDLHQQAQQFYKATYGQLGMDDSAVLSIFKTVSEARQQESFNEAVRDVFARKGKPVMGALAVIDQELEGTALTRLFCRSRLKRAMDVYYFSQDRHQGTDCEYRMEGFWGLPKHIYETTKKYKIASVLTLGSLLTLGYLVPTLSALAGGIILGCTLMGVIRHEVLAARTSGKNDEQSRAEHVRHLVQSGENLCSFLMTLPGVSGIWKTLNGSLKATLEGYQSAGGSLLSRIGTATKHGVFSNSHLKALAPAPLAGVQTPPVSKPNSLEVGAVLFGLLDEVLVPFSKLADLLSGRRSGVPKT